MNVLVYGGTGSQGVAVVERLLERGHRAAILTRAPEKLTPRQGVTAVAGDLNDYESVRRASKGIDAVALTVQFSLADESEALRHARHAIDAAAEAGVKLIVYNTTGPILDERIGAAGYDVRPQVLKYLKESSVPYIVLKPTTYLENLLGPWTREGVAVADTLVYPVAAEQRIGWMSISDLAAIIVAAIEHPELAGGEFVVSGIENLNGNELAARFSTALGREIRYQPLSLEEFGAQLDGLLGPGASYGILPGYRILRDHPERVTNWTDMRPLLEQLGITLTSVDQWVRSVAMLFSPQSTPQSG